MRGFRVIVHGVLAPVESAVGPLARGFYTAREVRAPDRATAQLQVLGLVQADPRVALIAAEWKSARPDLIVDEVVDLGADEPLDAAPKGFIFYNEAESLEAP